jgi:alcohol/geraniol dehydrogenase (NADP+)
VKYNKIYKSSGYFCNSKNQKLKKKEFIISKLKIGEIIIKVKYCGLCHSDLNLIHKNWKFAKFPFVPGHEIIGTVVAKSNNVKEFIIGERVAVGWFSKFCNKCIQCLKKNENMCRNYELVCVGRNGGFANYVKIDQSSVFKVPKEMLSKHLAPLTCAGWTVFGALTSFNIKRYSKVAILGIGGLGHLAIQFGNKMNFEMTAITTSENKIADCKKFGAKYVMDIKSFYEKKDNYDFILVTAKANYDWRSVLKTLNFDGTVCFISRPDKLIKFDIFDIMYKRARITASPGASKLSMRKMFDFARKNKIKPAVEVYDLNKVNNVIKKMINRKIKYRAVFKVS